MLKLNSPARVQAYVTTAEFEKLKQLSFSPNMNVSDLVKRATMDIGRPEKGPFSIFHVEEFTVSMFEMQGPMLFQSRFKEQWEGKVKPILAKAFLNWAHVGSLKKSNSNIIPIKHVYKCSRNICAFSFKIFFYLHLSFGKFSSMALTICQDFIEAFCIVSHETSLLKEKACKFILKFTST